MNAKAIPYGRQEIDASDLAAVAAVLTSDFLTQGPAVPQFEHAVAVTCGAGHAVAANSATSALHLACLALGLGPGDRLWTTPNTFVASANCARYCGADVDFVDIDPATLNLCATALETKLRQAAAQGKLPKIVVPVHFGGLPCDLERIAALAQEYGFRIIEDASHAIGARYRGQAIGAGQFSDITIFSFHPVKQITSGEGGMALTNDPDLARRMARLRSHGITREADELEGENDGPWYYQQQELGFNYRMTDIHAALGHSQLQRLPDFIARRRRLAERYDRLLAALPLRTQQRPDDRESAHHLYVVQLEQTAWRRPVFEALRRQGIGVNVHYIPVHRQPDYARLGFRAGDFPAAEHYYAGALTLPLFPGLDDAAQDFVVACLSDALRDARQAS